MRSSRVGVSLLLAIACGPPEGEPAPQAAGNAGSAGTAGASGVGGNGAAAGTAGAAMGGASGASAGGAGAGGSVAGSSGIGGAGGVSGAGGTSAGATAAGGSGNAGTSGAGSGTGAGAGGGSGEGQGGAAGAEAGGAGVAGSAGAAGYGGAPPTEPLTIYLAGDSTVSAYTDTASTRDQAGWGQMFDAEFGELVTVDNRAIGGRTARRFIDEGALGRIFEDITPGDYLFVQFGTNDGNKTATYEFQGQTIPYYLDPATDFKTYLMRYVEGARERGATPVFVTPPPRNSAYCTGGNGTGAHAAAMRELGAAEGVAVADLNQKTVEHLKAICPAPMPEDFFFVRADGSVDGTHFQENGARIMAGFVADGVREAGLPLAALLE